MPWLIEILGPQHSGKTTIADLASLILEENATKCFRMENDSLIYAFFPAYAVLQAAGQDQKAHALLDERRPLLADVVFSTIRRCLGAGYTVIHDHLQTGMFRQGVGERIAKQANAGYTSVFVTAPLDELRKRWTEPDEQGAKDLEGTYQRLQNLRRKSRFTMMIDTSETSGVEAARQIISAIYPHMNVNVLESITIKCEQRRIRNSTDPEDRRPLARLENVQIVRMTDAYIIIHRHKRFVIEDVYFKILELLDGKNTVEDIAERAGTHIDKVQKFVRILRQEKIIAM